MKTKNVFIALLLRNGRCARDLRVLEWLSGFDVSQVCGFGKSSLHTVFPIAWFAVHVHDGYDVDAFSFLHVDDGVGKCG